MLIEIENCYHCGPNSKYKDKRPYIFFIESNELWKICDVHFEEFKSTCTSLKIVNQKELALYKVLYG